MEKLYKILYIINNEKEVNQRYLSSKSNISIGGVNSIIKNLEEQEYLNIEKRNGKNIYIITKKGLDFLEKKLQQEHSKKIKLHYEDSKKVKQAVILAAGEKKVFEKPVGFLDIGDKKIVERQVELLEQNGIEKIAIVVGYKSEYYAEYAKNKNNIVLVKDRKSVV